MVTVLQILLCLFVMLIFTGTEYLIDKYVIRYQTTAMIANVILWVVSTFAALVFMSYFIHD